MGCLKLVNLHPSCLSLHHAGFMFSHHVGRFFSCLFSPLSSLEQPACKARPPPHALTVQSQDGWGERRRVGEGELDRVLFGSLQQLCGLVALLLLTALLLAFLLLSSQSLLRLLLLKETFETTRRDRADGCSLVKCTLQGGAHPISLARVHSLLFVVYWLKK